MDGEQRRRRVAGAEEGPQASDDGESAQGAASSHAIQRHWLVSSGAEDAMQKEISAYTPRALMRAAHRVPPVVAIALVVVNDTLLVVSGVMHESQNSLHNNKEQEKRV